MQVQRYSGLNGAGVLRECVVVLDVIRASNTVLGALDSGASQVWLVESSERAQALKAAHPDWELWGERRGVIIPGFQGDNSPAQARRRSLKGISVVLTTTNGARAAGLLCQAGPVFIGSLANATAVTEAIRHLAPSRVTLLAVGQHDNSKAPEDELVAVHLEAMLTGKPSDSQEVAEAILASESADRVRGLGQHDDLILCTQPDISRSVPLVVPGEIARVSLWNPVEKTGS